MAKFLAVWGSPGAGKTTFAVKLARTIYDTYQSTVIVVCTDLETPTLPVLFAREKKDNLRSIGCALAGTEITADTVMEQIVTMKGAPNLGFVGFADGENKYTYPHFDEDKANALYAVLGSLAHVVVIDCTSSLSNALTSAAIKNADEVFRLASPDLKSLSYFASQLPLYADPIYRLDRQLQGINIPDEDLYMPVEDVRAHIEDIRFSIPYSWAVKQQMLDGNLWQTVNDKRYNAKLLALAEKVV